MLTAHENLFSKLLSYNLLMNLFLFLPATRSQFLLLIRILSHSDYVYPIHSDIQRLIDQFLDRVCVIRTSYLDTNKYQPHTVKSAAQGHQKVLR